MKIKNVYVVPHMHWDREWYFSTEESQVLLVNNMGEIMDVLEKDQDYPAYILDGQTAILEDYFAAVPENFDRVKQLVKKGRLKIGPWYTQTDEMIVGAESITRNLLYGIKDSQKLGKPMMIGYVPDSFGQSAQMPMILNQFGIKRSLFWRGFSSNHKGTNSSEFLWRSSDNSEVIAENFPLGYASGKYLENDEKKLKKRMDKILTKLKQRTTGPFMLLPNGHDQMPIQKNIKEVLNSLNKMYSNYQFKLSSYDELFNHLEKKSDLSSVTGEMLDGKDSRVHRSIYSTRMDLKIYNTRIENKLTNILEPLASLARHVGIPYQHGLIELIWKKLMKNHAHDSIGGCVSDKVNQEILARYLEAEERTDMLIEFYKRRISEAVNINADDKLVLFNFLSRKSRHLVQATIITKANGFKLKDSKGKEVTFDVIKRDKIDPGIIDRQIVAKGDYEPFNRFEVEFSWKFNKLGYEVFSIKPIANYITTDNQITDVIDTDFYHINFNANGTVTIRDKQTGEIYFNVLNVENQADAGDEYDFSPLPKDRPIFSADLVKNANFRIKSYKNSYHATIDYKLMLPSNLENRLCENPKVDFMKFHFELCIQKCSRTIAIKTTITNKVKDQRTRILIPTNIKACKSISDNQFGVIHRPVRDSTINSWKKDNWSERPDPIFPFLSYVSLSDSNTVSLFTNSSREYEIIGDHYDTIALTLMRSIGWLGKTNLV